MEGRPTTTQGIRRWFVNTLVRDKLIRVRNIHSQRLNRAAVLSKRSPGSVSEDELDLLELAVVIAEIDVLREEER